MVHPAGSQNFLDRSSAEVNFHKNIQTISLGLQQNWAWSPKAQAYKLKLKRSSLKALAQLKTGLESPRSPLSTGTPLKQKNYLNFPIQDFRILSICSNTSKQHQNTSFSYTFMVCHWSWRDFSNSIFLVCCVSFSHSSIANWKLKCRLVTQDKNAAAVGKVLTSYYRALSFWRDGAKCVKMIEMWLKLRRSRSEVINLFIMWVLISGLKTRKKSF